MSTLLDSLGSMINADSIGSIGKALGADSAAVTKGLGAIGPLLLGSVARTASSPAGAESLLKMLPQDGGGLLSSLGSLFGSAWGGSAAGAGGALSSLLGPGFNSIAASLSKVLGFNVAPLIAAVAPAFLGVVAKAVKAQNLDASGLASLLAKEQSAFVENPANKEALALVASATDAGNQASALIASYGADWAKVASGPAAALFAVASADPSGPIGTIKEASAAGEKLREVTKGAAPTSLLAAAFAGGLTPDMLGQLKSVAPTKDTLIDVIKAGAAAVDARSPAEAQAYKDTVLAVAQAAAEASKEGGFLGIGGTLVSKEEQSALDRIKAALG
jgi:hypothetical protein